MTSVTEIQSSIGNGVIGLLVLNKEKQMEHMFVKHAEKDTVYPLRHKEVDEDCRELVEEEGYEIGSPLPRSKGALVEDSVICDGCKIPMLEEDSDTNVGSTPTTPSVRVLFRCPKCGSGRRVTHRRA